MSQSGWRRGWEDTKAGWNNWRFKLLQMVGAPMTGLGIGWLTEEPIAGAIAALGVIIVGLLSIWIGATVRAPYKQRNEARRKLSEVTTEGGSVQEPMNEITIEMAEIWRLGRPGEEGFPVGAHLRAVCVQVDVNFLAKFTTPLDAIELRVLNYRLPAIEPWIKALRGSSVIGGFQYFEVPEGMPAGDHEVQIMAYAAGQWWPSPKRIIRFPVPASQSGTGSNVP